MTIEQSSYFTIAAATAPSHRDGLLSHAPASTCWIWVDEASELNYQEADAFINCLFDGQRNCPEDKPLLIGDTVAGIDHIEGLVARFSEWPTLIERSSWELGFVNTQQQPFYQTVMQALGREFTAISDIHGLIAPRIIACLVNEACYLLADGTASAADVDTAMQLGTAYPLGPFDWGRQIGYRNIEMLLSALADAQLSYAPHPYLQQLR